MPFTPTGNFALSQIDAALTYYYYPNNNSLNSVVLSLNSDSGGLPGAVLMSWTLNDLPPYQACCTVETVVPASGVTLISGVQYWLVTSPTTSSTFANWNSQQLPGMVGINAQNLGSGWSSWLSTTRGAFDVIGTPLLADVPEPGTAVIGVGFLLLLILRRPLSRTPGP